MASSEFWQKLSASLASPLEREMAGSGEASRASRGPSKLWMLADVLTVVVAAGLSTLYKLDTTPLNEVRSFWHGTLIHGRSMGILLALLCGFTLVLIMTSRRLHLYEPTRLTGFLHEQRLSAQACFTSGLLLTGTLYLVHGSDIPREHCAVDAWAWWPWRWACGG